MRAALALLLAITLAGCASTTGGVTVPRVPSWVTPTDTRTYTAQDVSMAISQLVPFIPVSTTDTTFTAVSHDWIERVLPWSWEFARATGLAYSPESLDCDKFSLGLAYAANVAASRAGVRAQPLLARIDVRQVNAWGGAGAGGGHSLNAVLTDRGIYVIEPQSRTLAPLAEYPNRDYIFRVRLGG